MNAPLRLALAILRAGLPLPLTLAAKLLAQGIDVTRLEARHAM